MINLPDVTLVIAETRAHDLARITINDLVGKVSFGGVLIYSDYCDRIAVPDARYITVPNWPNKIISGSFYYTEAARAITTSHALLMEWDAGICNPAMWSDEFLQFDYIGAPWGAGMCASTPAYKVGNGGFALVTKRLVDFCYEHKLKIATDMDVCRTHRRDLEQRGGFKWAPESVAARFSYEGWTARGPAIMRSRPESFGFHSVANWPIVLDRDELVRRAKVLTADSYCSKKAGLLWRTAPWLRDELNRILAPCAAPLRA